MSQVESNWKFLVQFYATFASYGVPHQQTFKDRYGCGVFQNNLHMFTVVPSSCKLVSEVSGFTILPYWFWDVLGNVVILALHSMYTTYHARLSYTVQLNAMAFSHQTPRRRSSRSGETVRRTNPIQYCLCLCLTKNTCTTEML